MMLPSTLIAALLLSASPSLALWPQPRQITTGTTPLKLAPGFSIKVTGIKNVPSDLTAAISRSKGQLTSDKLQPLVVDRGASSTGVVKSAKTLKSLSVSLLSTAGPVKSISEEAVLPFESRREGYTLVIPADGSDATLKANSTLGLLRGLTTFGQIWYQLDDSQFTLEAPFNIVDSPAYVRALYTLVRVGVEIDLSINI
jgi:hexosaminidase